MKKLILSTVLCTGGFILFAQKENKFNDTAYLQPVEVLAVRAAEKAPFAKWRLLLVRLSINASSSELLSAFKPRQRPVKSSQRHMPGLARNFQHQTI